MMNIDDHDGLREIVDLIGSAERHGGTSWSVDSIDDHGNPHCTRAAQIPGHESLPGEDGATHVIVRSSVIGGERIGWHSRSTGVGSTAWPNGDPFGPIDNHDDAVAEVWTQITAAIG